MKKIEIIGYKKGYRVDKNGSMFNPSGKEICANSVKKYKQTNITVNGKRHRLTVHRLQAYQKYGNKMYKEGIIVRHKNNNSHDNSYKNILIGTHKQNANDRPKASLLKHALYAASFCKKHDHDAIKKYHSESRSYKKTMDKFNISSKGTLNYILNRNIKILK